MSKPKCPIEDVYCPKHDFIHGKEAEELREGMEALLKRYPDEIPSECLQDLLDKVDARDSVAWLESK